MAERGTLETLLAEIGKALLPLKAALASPDDFYALMLRLGWRAETIPEPLEQLGGGLNELFAELETVLGGGVSIDGDVAVGEEGASAEISADAVLRLGHAIEQTVDGIRGIASAPDAAFPAELQADDFKTRIPAHLLDFLLVEYLTTHQPRAAFALRALGVVKTTYAPTTGNRPPQVHVSIDFADLPKVFENPTVVLENAFGWGRDDFDFGEFSSQVDNLLTTLGVDVFTERLPPAVTAAVEAGLALPDVPVPKALKAVLFERARPAGRMAAELRLLRLPGNGSHKPGFALMPAFNGLLDFKMQAGPDVAIVITSDLDLQGGVGLLVRPGEPIDMVLGFDGDGAPAHATGSIRAAVERSQLDDAPILLLGKPDATRLQYRKLSGAGGVNLDPSGAVDVFAELEARGLEFVLKPDEADSFIRSFFPADGASVGFDLALGVSYLRGFYFRGTSHLEIAVPAHIRIGPIELQSMTVALRPEAGRIPIDLGVAFKLELGPLTAVVENIGLRTTFAFPDDGGNLGPLDLSVGFKPPVGIGLTVDAGVVKGGGYLRFDPEKEEYAGVLELQFTDVVSLKAIGLLTTRLPDGSKGFSLLIVITAEFGTGIQLAFGFVLLAVGGLLGLNRTMRLQPLMEGVRTGAVNGVMFPKDVIANAPKIISDLGALFPPQAGVFLIGPMAKLAWGTPAIVTVSLGIIIEIPGNVAILGVLRVAMPAEDAPILILQVNFAGAIEFDRKRIYFFAALFDSRILFLTIEGEMGLLVAFGDDANFVVSVGGFHPRFSPPPLPIPTPKRISLDLISSPTARVRLEGYFAVTTNTAQFGARAEMFYGLGSLNAQGHVAFDALFQFSPFYFVIEISASFSVKVFGAGLFSVRIRGTLEGPTPWRAQGEGSISLLFFSISVDIDVTWGESRDTTLPPIAVMPLFKAELEKAESWRALLPAGNNLLVSLRPLPAGDTALVLHPVGVLRVTQRRLPLELTLDKVGSQKPNDVKRLSVALTGGGLSKVGDAYEQFAPAQFQDLEDADKLSRPAFGPERGGLDLSAAGGHMTSSRMVRRIVRYEEIILDSNFKRFARRFTKFAGSLFEFFLQGASISKSDLSQAKKRQLQPFSEKVDVGTDTYVVAFHSTNNAYAAEASVFATEASAREYLARQVAQDPKLAESLHVIPGFERAA